MNKRNYIIKINFIIPALSLFLLFNFDINSKSLTSDLNNNRKVLVLIVSSDNLTVYPELEKIWRTYMHYDPSHIEAYFIKGNPKLETDYKIDNDIIYSKIPECLNPCMLNKTILSLEGMLPRLQEFDFIVRTNLSSFYIFPRLLQFLDTCPKEKFYCGSRIKIKDGTHIIAGSNIIITPDIVKDLIANKDLLFDNGSKNEDVIIGHFIVNNLKIKLKNKNRFTCTSIEHWNKNKNKIPNDIFHIRIKNRADLRLKDDIYIQKQLVKKFYNIG